MSVEPGFGWSENSEKTHQRKIRETKALIEEMHSHALVEVDGGIK